MNYDVLRYAKGKHGHFQEIWSAIQKAGDRFRDLDWGADPEL